MRKVLCIDGFLPILSLYQDELSEEGYEVILAKDQKEAMQKFATESPEVVILDIRPPVQDAIETLAAMQHQNKQVPVILTTCYSPLCQKSVLSGVEVCVVKSSDLTELKQKIREALDKRKTSVKT